jgi:uncharacterized integral membrane protein
MEANMSARASEGVPGQASADSATPLETRGERFRRKAHRTGLYLYAFITVTLLVCFLALAVANTHQVEFSWVVGSSTVSLVWIVIFSAISYPRVVAWDRYQRGLPLANAGATPPLT